MLGDVETAADTNAQKVAAVLSFAANKRNGQSKVAMSPHEVNGCTGVSRRYADELIDTMVAEMMASSSGSRRGFKRAPGRNDKALLVDCDAVHDVERTVNSFTTDNNAEGEVQ